MHDPAPPSRSARPRETAERGGRPGTARRAAAMVRRGSCGPLRKMHGVSRKEDADAIVGTTISARTRERPGQRRAYHADRQAFYRELLRPQVDFDGLIVGIRGL